MAHSSLAIGNEFIRRSLSVEGLITPMHVQKFVYFAHGFTLAAIDQPLIEEPVEAWSFGPVIRRLYDALKIHGKNPIERLIRWGDDSPFGHDFSQEAAFTRLSNIETSIVEDIWQTYGSYPAFQLSALTHEQGTPWSKVFRESENVIIPNFRIAEYFKGL